MKKFFDEVKRIVTDKDGNFRLSYSSRAAFEVYGIRGLVAHVYALALASVTYDDYGIEPSIADLEYDALRLYDEYMSSALTSKRAKMIARVKNVCEKAVKGG